MRSCIVMWYVVMTGEKMSKKHYIRCSLPQPYYDSDIDIIQLKMFRQMEESVGEIRGITAIPGVKLDFNVGLRLEIPVGDFHVRISDAWSDRFFFDADVSDVCLVSLEKYAIFFQIDIWQGGQQVFSHTFNPEGQNIIFHCSRSTQHKAYFTTQYILYFIKENWVKKSIA